MHSVGGDLPKLQSAPLALQKIWSATTQNKTNNMKTEQPVPFHEIEGNIVTFRGKTLSKALKKLARYVKDLDDKRICEFPIDLEYLPSRCQDAGDTVSVTIIN